MSKTSQDPTLRALASFAVMFSQHPDIQELRRQGAILTGQHAEPNGLAGLAATYADTPAQRAELDARARKVLATPEHPMRRPARVAIGCYLMILGAGLLVLLPWAWSVASHAIGRRSVGVAHFLGFAFGASRQFSVVAIVILTAMLGSVVILTLTFSYRAGQETLDRGYVWWYLTRPISAAALGTLFYMAIFAGYFSQTITKASASLFTAAVIGGLAGLFTDQVLEKMRSVLGLRAFNRTAADGSEGAGNA